MLRRIVTRVLIVLLLAVLGAWMFGPGIVDRKFNTLVPGNQLVISDSVRRLHATLAVADLHADALLWGRNLLARADHGHVDLPRMREGNVTLQVFSVVTKTPRNMNYDRNTGETDNVRLLGLVQRWPLAAVSSLRARAIHQADRLQGFIGKSSGAMVLITDREGLREFLVRRGVKPDVYGTLLAIEGLHALDGRLESVDTLYAHGFRMMGLTHFFDNEVGGSAHGVTHGGLTPFGRQVIQRMEALHITVDLAHASPQLVSDVLAVATRPVVVSHTGVTATCPGPRNLTDDQLRAIARNGGVVGIGYWDAATCTLGARSIAAAIVHVIDVAGIDHVALGSDFDGATAMPFATDRLAEVTQALLDARLTLPQVKAVMGGNVLRLLGQNLP